MTATASHTGQIVQAAQAVPTRCAATDRIVTAPRCGNGRVTSGAVAWGSKHDGRDNQQ